MTLDTGMSLVTITESGEDTTDKWLYKDPVDNQKSLPGAAVLHSIAPKESFAYPIDIVVRAFSTTPVEDIFSRQVAISVIPSPAGLEALEIEGDRTTTADIVSKASFYLSIINGNPFLVSEDSDFLRFPIGGRNKGAGMGQALMIERIAASAMMETLAEMGKINADLVNSVFPDELNRLILNIRAEELVDTYPFQAGLYEAFLTFTTREDENYARDIGLKKVEGIKNRVLDSSSNTIWQSTSRFSWEGEDSTLVDEETVMFESILDAIAWSGSRQRVRGVSPMLLGRKSSGKTSGFVAPKGASTLRQMLSSRYGV